MTTSALAQSPERLDQVVSSHVEAGEFTGAVLVARDTQILLDKGYGEANREWGIPNAGDTRFRLGSLTKQFTAAGILLLVEQEQVDLDAPIKTYLPQSPASWDKVTVRHLLTHGSGIANLTNLPDFQSTKTLPASLDSLIDRFKDLPLDFQPGTKVAYSNSGYILLSAILEQVSGQSYADFINARLFQPLGMFDSGYDRHEMILLRRASGYTPSATGIVNADYTDMSIPSGAGALYSSTRDLLKWNRALYGGQVLKPASLSTMQTPAQAGHAMGLIVTQIEGRPLIWHNGGIEGFNTYLAYDPTDKISIVVLGNLNGPAPDKIGQQLVTLMRGGTVTLASERQSVSITPDVLKTYEGVYPIVPGFELTVTQVEDRLMVQATGQQAFEIKPEATDRFFLSVVDAQITFTRNDAGQVDGLILRQNGRDMPAKRK